MTKTECITYVICVNACLRKIHEQLHEITHYIGVSGEVERILDGLVEDIKATGINLDK